MSLIFLCRGENPLSPPIVTATPWLLENRSGQSDCPRVFCFSHAGVGATVYRNWQEQAGSGISIARIQLPGRENRIREPLYESIPPLVEGLVEAIGASLSGSFAFFGHSLGATVAFETARALRRAGLPQPMALGVAAARAPQLPWPHPPLRDLDDLPLLHEVQRRYGSVPPVMLEDRELREMLLPILRADLRLVETYQYEDGPPFAFPIVAFGGERDHMVGRPEIEAWAAQTTGAFRSRFLPGGHLFPADHPATILADLRNLLGQQH